MSVPQSPSVRAVGRKPLAFERCSDLDCLLASAVVGKHAHFSVLLAYRAVSSTLRAAVDSEIEEWCAEFSSMQSRRADLLVARKTPSASEEQFRLLVALERRSKAAFGGCRGALGGIVNVSLMDRACYFGAASCRCVLCGQRMTSAPRAVDAESLSQSFAFAHHYCQRKHVAVLNCGVAALPKTGEPRDVQKELHAVHRFHCRSSPDVWSRDLVLGNLSNWYRAHAAPRSFGPIHVWMRRHPAVRDEDTLYGALGISDNDVSAALELQTQLAIAMKQQLEERRLAVARKTQELAEAYEADLRVWLGRGRTRWRSVEDIDALHVEILSSARFDRLVEGSRRGGGVGMVCNTLHLFSRTLDYVPGGLSLPMLDLLVRHLELHRVFGPKAAELQYFDSVAVHAAVDKEAVVYARALHALQTVGPGGVAGVDVWRASETTPDTLFAIAADLCVGEGLVLSRNICMTREQICKFKYEVAHEIPEGSALPALPLDGDGGEEVAAFMRAVLCRCFAADAGMARALALSWLIDSAAFREVVGSLATRAA